MTPCTQRSIDIRTDTHPIRSLDCAETLDRIAACTSSELYLYAGIPGQEQIVYLGRAALDDGCDALAIIDDRRVLVTSRAGAPRLVVFSAKDAT